MRQCSYCGGDCPQSYITGACDGFLGDIDGLDQDSMTDKLNPEREKNAVRKGSSTKRAGRIHTSS